MTPFCNLPEGFEKKAAIQIEPDVDSVATGIQTLMNMTENELKIMGENGFKLVQEKFTWEKIAASTLQLYGWATGKNEKPDFVLP
jgi:poly(glycerol-phosphate) alpha-glucosyltransferase